ncbi:MAG: class I SAM-dependent methyltransferase family protein [Chloroflexi bacterium]|nr:class I SAM-dependent methyltransferase family protein [Chloroflexota bacterium]
MSLARVKWAVLRAALRTVGRASSGISLGFAYGFDSGEMLDYVYQNKAQGKLLLGKAIDRVYLNAIGWRAIRARKALLKEFLHREIAQRRVDGKPLVILDVASGPGRYLQELCLEVRAQGNPLKDLTIIICRDMDAQGLNRGRRRAEGQGLVNMRYEVGDACDPASLATVQPRPDIVVVSGLYELFTDPAPIQRSLQGIHRIMNPGGALVFTTQVRHPQLELIANLLVNREGKPWVMRCRDAATVEGWGQAAGFAVRGSQPEPVGLFTVTTARRIETAVSNGVPSSLQRRGDAQ